MPDAVSAAPVGRDRQAGLMLVSWWVEVLVKPDAHPRADAPSGGGRQGRGHEY
jgi:hypothetical protein